MAGVSTRYSMLSIFLMVQLRLTSSHRVVSHFHGEASRDNKAHMGISLHARADANHSRAEEVLEDVLVCNRDGMKNFAKLFNQPELEHGKYVGDVEYNNPNSDEVALFLYPNPDSHGADVFKIDRYVCARMLGLTKFASVKMRYLPSMDAAFTELEKSTENGKTLQHLVLGGHGAYHTLHWGNNSALDLGNGTVDRFLEKIREKAPDSLLLDSCSTAQKQHKGGITLCKHVANKTLESCQPDLCPNRTGVGHVFCSSVPLDNSMMDITSYQPYRIKMTEDGKRKGVHYTNRHTIKVGDKLHARYWQYGSGATGREMNCTVESINCDGSINLVYSDGDHQTVAFGMITEAEDMENDALCGSGMRNSLPGGAAKTISFLLLLALNFFLSA
eukprot:TRINITY_DN60562_c0_g2_i4.p1 TRINITY_DN60562_c0_g2~~TRINITY_DN60562_c0_g2_i4.p1  ORF type:complete len:388 (-),score=56.54 TRINITY_DN60562_c0_g2_i4:356-1519(-)